MLCNDCGSEIVQVSKFCPDCGAALDEVTVDDDSAAGSDGAKKKRASVGSIIGRALLAIAMVLAVLVMAYVLIVFLGFFIFGLPFQ